MKQEKEMKNVKEMEDRMRIKCSRMLESQNVNGEEMVFKRRCM